MNWVEIFQVVGPIVLGLAGILSGYGIARTQVKSAGDAERRQHTYDAYSQLLRAAVETETFLALYPNEPEESSRSASPLEVMRGEASAAIAKCYLVNGGRLAPLAEDLNVTIRATLALPALRADDDASREAFKSARWEVIHELMRARQKFAFAARLELGWRDSRRKQNRHRNYLESLDSLELPPTPRLGREEHQDEGLLAEAEKKPSGI